MATLGPGEGKSTLGLIDGASLLFGSWEYVGAIQLGVDYELGSVVDAMLEMTREDYFHVSAKFPRFYDYIVPTKFGMRFAGNIEEIKRQNLNFMVGNLLASTLQYIYVGPTCDVNFFSFAAKRNRCDDLIIEAFMWKCLTTGLIQLGNADEPIKAPFEVHALYDQAGTYGGSATAPLGYLWVPVGVT